MLSTGKKVAAAGVEAAIKADPLIEQCCVLGNNRPSVIAIVTLNPTHWAALAKQKRLDVDLPNEPNASKAIIERLARVMSGLPSYAQVRAVYAELKPWTVEDGSMTPTQKIKRNIIEERYCSVIEALKRSPLNLVDNRRR